MIHSIILPVIGILMMLCAGFIGGFYAFADENDVALRHLWTATKRRQLYGKMLQYTLIAGSLYVIVYTVDILLAGLVYLYSEYAFPRVMRAKYEKIFFKENLETNNQDRSP